MALTKIDAPTTGGGGAAASAPPKTITVRNYSGNTALMYTVPTGRKFVGYVGSFSGYQHYHFITASGQTVNNGTTSIQRYGHFFARGESNNSYHQSDRPITLHAGDQIHTTNNGGNHNTMVLGEETDV